MQFYAHLLLVLSFAADSLPASIVIEPDTSSTTVVAAVPDPQQPATAPPSQRLHHEEILEQLGMQAAMREARGMLATGAHQQAVNRLEPYLAQAEGSEQFLELLEAAYRGTYATLLHNGETEQARSIAERLRILGTSNPKYEQAAATSVVTTVSATRVAKPEDLLQEKPKVAANIPAAVAKQPLIARGNLDEETAKQPSARALPPAKTSASANRPEQTGQPLAQAEQLFRQKDYAAALAKYEQAYEQDAVAVQASRERWGYCLLYVSVQRYNELLEHPGSEKAVWQKLVADVQLAKRLAPDLDYADTVLQALERRQSDLTVVSTAATTPAAVSAAAGNVNRYGRSAMDQIPARSFRHLPGRSQSWSMTETPNFLIYHRDPALAEEIARIAEAARTKAIQLWFPGEQTETWTPRCELYLYPTAHEYARETNVGPQSPGHSKTLNEGSRIIRQVLMRVDDANMKQAVLPHEIAHVVFAGRFGSQPLPRWADEGMAVLTEPVDKQQAHLANLARMRSRQAQFTCGELMTMADYPGGARMGDFYAQSVGVCRYLVDLGGERKFVEFLRTSLQTNSYEKALQRVYGLRSFAQLEGDFDRYVASLGSRQGGFVTARR